MCSHLVSGNCNCYFHHHHRLLLPPPSIPHQPAPTITINCYQWHHCGRQKGSQLSNGETRNANPAALSPQRRKQIPVNDLLTFILSRARPHLNLQECYSQTPPPSTFTHTFVSQSVEPIFRGMSHVFYSLLTPMLSWQEITPNPRPLGCRIHLHGGGQCAS